MSESNLIKITLVFIATFASIAFSPSHANEEVYYVVGRVKLGIETEAGTDYIHGPMLAAITQRPHSDNSFLVEVDDEGYFFANVDSIDVPYRIRDVRYDQVTFPAFNGQVFAFYRFRQNQVGQSGYNVNLMDIGETTVVLKKDERLLCNIYLNKITLKLNQKTAGGTDIDAAYDVSPSTDKPSYPASQYYSTGGGDRLIREVARVSLWENREYCTKCTHEVSFWPEDVWPFKITLEK